MRVDGRPFDGLRDISLTTNSNPYAEGSCLVKFGLTEVLCTASVQDKVPQWLKGKGSGWITAEYGMLPRATAERKDREVTKGRPEGRTTEIQRLIGRSIRSVANLKALDGLTIWIDCDVLVADGGTRTAAITGAYVALALALKRLEKLGKLKGRVIQDQVAAVSCGLTNDGPVLDMNYLEDSSILADANFVMSSQGHWVEIQMSAEKRPVTSKEMADLQGLAERGIKELFELQKLAVDSADVS